MEDKPLGCSNTSAPCRKATRRAEGTGAQEANLHKAKKLVLAGGSEARVSKKGCKDFNHTSNIKFHCWTSTTQPKCTEKGEDYWTSCFSQWDNWQAHQCKNKETSPTSCSAQSKVWVTLGQFDSTNKNGSFRSHQISKSNEPVFIPLASPEFLSKLNIMGGGWSTPIIKIFYSLFSRLRFFS